MCYQAANRYTYLSMCPCCNAVSRYAYLIKKHLKQKHVNVPENIKTRVIPIRVASKYVKDIRRTLRTVESYKKQHVNFKMTGDKEFKGCSRTEADSGIEPMQFMKEKQVQFIKNENTDTVAFLSECPNVKTEVIADMENVNAGAFSDIEGNENVALSKVDLNVPRGHECPYCKMSVVSLDSIQCHVRRQHSEHVQIVTIKQESHEIESRNPLSAETIIIAWTCQRCTQSFETLSDLTLHVESMHSRDDNTPDTGGCVLSNCNDTGTNVSDQVDSSFDRNNVKNENSPSHVPNYLTAGSFSFLSNQVYKDSTVMHVEPKVTSLLSTDSDLNTASSELSEKSFSKCVQARGLVPSFSKDAAVPGTETIVLPYPNTGINITASSRFSENNLGRCVQTRDIVPGCSYDNQTQVLVTSTYDTQMQNGFRITSLIQSSQNDFNAINASKKNNKRKCSSEQVVHGIQKGSKKRSAKESKANRYDFSIFTKYLPSSTSVALDTELADVNEGVKKQTQLHMCYKCPFCDFFLFHRNYVISHVESMHPEVKNVVLKDVIKYSVEMKASETRREHFQCPSCIYTSLYRELMFSHINRCSSRPPNAPSPIKINCILPDFLIETQLRSAHLICPYCMMTMQGKDKFDIHFNEHFTDSNIYFNDSNIKVELSVVLPDMEKRDEDLIIKLECFMCTYCSYLHNERYNVRNHMRRQHKQEEESPVIKCILFDNDSSESSHFIANLKFVKSCLDPNSVSSEKEAESLMIEEKTVKAASDEVIQEKCSKIMLGGQTSNFTTKRLMCPVCNYSTDSKRDISVHFRGKHPGRIKATDLFYMLPDNLIRIGEKKGCLLLTCKLCQASSQNLYPLLCHIEEKHENLPSSDPYVPVPVSDHSKTQKNNASSSTSSMNQVTGGSDVLTAGKSSSATKNVPSKCLICWKEMSKTDSMDCHIQQSHPEMADVYGVVCRMIDVVSAASAFRVDGSEQYICDVCLEKDFNRREFYNHLYNKHPPKRFDTTHCPPGALHGVSDDRWRCNLCPKKFRDEESLKSHKMLLSHRRKTKNQFGDVLCIICACLVPSSTDLRIHLNSHNMKHYDKLPCHVCSCEIPLCDMKNHLTDKHKTAASCNICTLQHRVVSTKCHRCQCCSALFCHQFYLDLHMFEKHHKKKLMVKTH